MSRRRRDCACCGFLPLQLRTAGVTPAPRVIFSFSPPAAACRFIFLFASLWCAAGRALFERRDAAFDAFRRQRR